MKHYLNIAILFALIAFSAATQAVIYSDGFESGTGYWGTDQSTITQTASGTNGIVASSGNYYALVDTYTGTELNTLGYTYPDSTLFPGRQVTVGAGFETIAYNLDVYIDPSMWNSGDTWSLQMATKINGNYPGNFTFFAYTRDDGTVDIGRQNNDTGAEWYSVDSSSKGWYTFSSVWTETTEGLIDYNYIFNSSGTQVWGGGDASSSYKSPYATTATDTYTPGYYIVTNRNSTSPTVAIDNLSYEIAVVPEPATLALLGLGGLLLRKRK